MATTTVFKDAKVYHGGYDISGALNQLSFSYEFPELSTKAFGDACDHSYPGLPKLSFDFAGYGYSDGTDELEDLAYAALGTVSAPMTWAPTGAVNTPAFFTEILQLSMTIGGSVGELYALSASGVGQGSKLVRGTILEVAGAKTTSTTGTARQVGAVGATQHVYGIMHVLSVSGTDPTLDMIVESDDDVGFASGATRLTFTQAAAVGSEFLTPVAGAITDDWWRCSWTIGGTDTPTFSVVVVIGIL